MMNKNVTQNDIASHRKSELSMLFNEKLTENGDNSFKSTGNHLIDLLYILFL